MISNDLVVQQMSKNITIYILQPQVQPPHPHLDSELVCITIGSASPKTNLVLHSILKIKLSKGSTKCRSTWPNLVGCCLTPKDTSTQPVAEWSHSTWDLNLNVKVNLCQRSMKSGSKWSNFGKMLPDSQRRIHTSSCKMVGHIVPEN